MKIGSPKPKPRPCFVLACVFLLFRIYGLFFFKLNETIWVRGTFFLVRAEPIISSPLFYTFPVLRVPKVLVFATSYLKAVVPKCFGTKDWFCGRQFFHGQGTRGCGWFWIIQVHYIYYALYFYYHYISSTSDHQALDPAVRGPLSYSNLIDRC